MHVGRYSIALCRTELSRDFTSDSLLAASLSLEIKDDGICLKGMPLGYKVNRTAWKDGRANSVLALTLTRDCHLG